MDHDGFAKFALALGAFALQQMPPTSFRPNDLSRGCEFESLGHGFLGFAAGDGFWHGAWTIAECIPKGNREV